MRFFLAMLEKHLVVRMGRATRDSLAVMVLPDEQLLLELLEVVKSGTQTQRMKGAWVLSGIHAFDRARLGAYHSFLLALLQVETVGGVKREILRCFENCSMEGDTAEQLLVIAMDWVTDEHQDLAVRYLCYRLMKPMLGVYPELYIELQQRVELFQSKFGRFP